MNFNFGGKPAATGGTPGTAGGFSLGTPSTGAASGFAFGAPKTTAVAAAPSAAGSTGGFSFSTTGGGLGGGTIATQPTAASTTGGFSFGTPSAGGTQAAGTAGFSLGGTPSLGVTPSTGGTQATTSGGFSLGGTSTFGAAPSTGGTQPAASGGFSLGGASTLGAAPSTGSTPAATTGGFSLGGASTLGAAPSTGGTSAASGFKLGGTPSLGAAASTTTTSTAGAAGFKLGLGTATATTTGGLGLGGISAGAGGSTTSTTLASILKPTGTAAPTTRPGLSLTMPNKTTAGLTGATATTGISLGLGAKTTVPAATSAATSTAGAAAAAASTGPKMSYQQLEQAINKWTVELEEQEKIFLKQATQVNAWDRLLIENGEKITSLHNDMEKVKADQQRLEHELDYIVAQQRELEDMLVPLEETVAAQQQGSIYTQHADLERERTYQLAENTDGQLKRMVQDLKDIIDHLNTANTPLDNNDPMNQIAKILNAHMDSLQWIDQNTVMLQRKVDEVAKQCDVVRRDQERNVHLAFD